MLTIKECKEQGILRWSYRLICALGEVRPDCYNEVSHCLFCKYGNETTEEGSLNTCGKCPLQDTDVCNNHFMHYGYGNYIKDFVLCASKAEIILETIERIEE